MLAGGAFFTIKLFSLVRESVVARSIGASSEYDYYLVLWSVVSFLSSLLVVPAQIAILPSYLVEKQSGRPGAFVHRVLLIANKVLLATCIVCIIIGNGLDGAADPDDRNIMRVLVFPCLYFDGISIILGSFTNAERYFARTILCSASVPIAQCLFLEAFPMSGVVILSAATLTGYAVQAVLLLGLVNGLGFSIKSTSSSDVGVKETRGQYSLLLLGQLFAAAIPLIDQHYLLKTGPGNLALISYASKLPNLVIGVLSNIFVTVMFAEFSRLAAASERQKLKRLSALASLTIASVSAVAAALAVAGSKAFVALLYGNSTALLADQIESILRLQTLLLVQAPLVLPAVMLGRVLSSVNRNGYLTVIAGVSLGMTIICDPICVAQFSLVGVPYATLIVRATVLLLWAAVLRVLSVERA